MAAITRPTYYVKMPATKTFQIKICGITSVQDAVLVSEAGADAIGLNFWPRSRRYVSLDAACDIATAAARNLITVGVFVNSSADDIARTADEVGLDWLQLHGDERPELLAQLPPHLGVMRAFRCGAGGLIDVQGFLKQCRSLGRMPDTILVDSDTGPDYGGTGRVAHWSQIANERNYLGELSLVLAGGLTPQNVAAAIATVRPDGVDVASGVESRPGRKSAMLVQDFVDGAREAFARL